jgi:hypothetical protein
MPVPDGGRGELLQHFLSLTSDERAMLLRGLRLPVPARRALFHMGQVTFNVIDAGLKPPEALPTDAARPISSPEWPDRSHPRRS